MNHPQIDVSDDDFGTIVTCAVRYSLGRLTYMPSLVQDFVTPLIPHLHRLALSALVRDVAQYEHDLSATHPEGFRTQDNQGWHRLAEAAQAELCRRENRKTNE